MANKVKWGVVGSGGIARRRTIPEGIALATNAELTAVHDIDPRANEQVARQYGAQAASSIEELLAADLQAVYVATPAYLHYEQVLTCAAVGKHVLCEKPLGMTVAEAETMVAVMRQAGLLLGTAFMMRFLVQHQAARKLIREGLWASRSMGGHSYPAGIRPWPAPGGRTSR